MTGVGVWWQWHVGKTHGTTSDFHAMFWLYEMAATQARASTILVLCYAPAISALCSSCGMVRAQRDYGQFI